MGLIAELCEKTAERRAFAPEKSEQFFETFAAERSRIHAAAAARQIVGFINENSNRRFAFLIKKAAQTNAGIKNMIIIPNNDVAGKGHVQRELKGTKFMAAGRFADALRA